MFKVINIKDLHQCYSTDSQQRYQQLLSKFEAKYQSKPDFISRAPGRVNLIGEHIDYEGYGVLPAAIEKDCLIAVKKIQSQTIQINHVLNQQFPSCKLSKYPSKISSQIVHSYAKYFAAGYRAGTLELIEEQKVSGLQILIQGNIPWASGVSSSSAFCVCSALTSYHANKTKQIQKQQLVQRCIRFERQVGTASGGMDQSISILGKTGSCLFIEFNPIKATKVEMPSEEYAFIIMNSLVDSPKLNTAIYHYNKRVCQCRISIHLLAKNMGISKEIYSKWKILKQIQQWTELEIHQMPLLVEKFVPRQKYTRKTLEDLLETDLMEIVGDISLAADVLEANKHFGIYQAAYHVFSEAYRVINFIDVCKSPLNNISKGLILGELMNQSQDSCSDLYDCSCPQLDELTKTARVNGAVGSRLTGAGWGGCTVSLVPSKKVDCFIQKMKDSYYSKEELKDKVKTQKIENVLFPTQPSQGACVIVFQ